MFLCFAHQARPVLTIMTLMMSQRGNRTPFSRECVSHNAACASYSLLACQALIQLDCRSLRCRFHDGLLLSRCRRVAHVFEGLLGHLRISERETLLVCA